MPEFPPVTMKTLPLRSGRVSGWKVMLRTNTTRVNLERWRAEKQTSQRLMQVSMVLTVQKDASGLSKVVLRPLYPSH